MESTQFQMSICRQTARDEFRSVSGSDLNCNSIHFPIFQAFVYVFICFHTFSYVFCSKRTNDWIGVRATREGAGSTAEMDIGDRIACI